MSSSLKAGVGGFLTVGDNEILAAATGVALCIITGFISNLGVAFLI